MDEAFEREPGQLCITQYLGDGQVSSVRVTVQVRKGDMHGADTLSLWCFSDGRPVQLS